MKLKDVHVDALARYMDKDNDKQIEFDEFYEWWCRHATTDGFDKRFESTMELLAQAYTGFMQYDADGSGELDLQEFRKMYEALYKRVDVPLKEIEDALASLDKNGDGRIQFSEFVEWLNWF